MNERRYKIVKAQLEHIVPIAMDMRAEDIEEIRTISNWGPTAALTHSFNMTDPDKRFTGIIDNRPVCMFGFACPNLLLDVAVPWLLTSNAIEKHKKAFMRYSRMVMQQAQKDIPFMVNYVDAKYERAIKWLKWLGFTVGELEQLGTDGFVRRIELRRR